MQSYVTGVERLRQIAKTYQPATEASEKEMARIATHIVSLWDGAK
jgi:hypothetical protein